MGQGNLVVATGRCDSRAAESRERRRATSGQASAGEKRRRPTAQGRAAAASRGDIHLSAHYACTHCGLSFEPPSPQLFSFNSPQGMCTGLRRAGRVVHVRSRAVGSRPELVVQARLLRADRPVARFGPLAAAHLSRRGRNGRAQAAARAKGTMLDTPGRSSTRELQNAVAVGHRRPAHHVHLAARRRQGTNTAASSRGSFPQLLDKYRNSQKQDAAAAARKIHARAGLRRSATAQRLNRAGPGR